MIDLLLSTATGLPGRSWASVSLACSSRRRWARKRHLSRMAKECRHESRREG